MLSHNKRIFFYVLISALAISVSAHAGLYGFASMKELPPAQHLDIPPRRILDYRMAMRDLVVALAQYGKSRNHDFQVLTHEGQYLLDKSLWEYHRDSYNRIRKKEGYVNDISFLSFDIPETDEEEPFTIQRYVSLIDGIVINNHYCGNTPLDSTIKEYDIPIFSIEQCPDDTSLDQAILDSITDKIRIYPFIYPHKAFRKIYHQLIINETADSITGAKDAQNISFLINDSDFLSIYHMVNEIRNSNYDIIVISPVFQSNRPFSKEDVDAMKFKKNGGKRLILALYNLSEISNTDYLWQKKWNKKLPSWIAAPSYVTENAYIAKYWTPQWKKLSAHYFKSIVDSGYDGVFLTGLENHSYFEHNKPLE